MATVALTDITTAFTVNVNIENLKLFECVYSQPFELNQLNWRIKLKRIANDEHSLAIYLECVFVTNTIALSCEGQATVTLLPTSRDTEPVVKRLRTKVFDYENCSIGVDDFIKWDKFAEEYVRGNVASFNIELLTGPLRRRRKELQTIERSVAKFFVEIVGARNLDQCSSSEIVLRGIRWTVHCDKQDNCLAIFLNGNAADIDAEWTCTVEASFTLLSFKSDGENIAYQFTKDFGETWKSEWGYPQFIKWSTFVDETKEYISDDNRAKLYVQLKVEAAKPNWELQASAGASNCSSIACSVCYDSFRSGEIQTIKCGHLFCKSCFFASIARRLVCPTCQSVTDATELHPIFF